MNLPTILLVDDYEVVSLEKELLSRSAVLILTADNGRDALDMTRRHRPDLVVLGLDLPEMDGIACCAAIRRDPDLSGIPVIMVARSAGAADRERCAGAGCNGFFTFPFTRQEFLKAAQQHIPEIDRRMKRIPWRAPVSLTIAGQHYTGTSEDLSLNGIYIATGHAVAVNDPVSVLVALDTLRTAWLAAQGAVAWINPWQAPLKPEMPEGFGIQFLEMSDSDRERLLQFLRSRERSANSGKRSGLKR